MADTIKRVRKTLDKQREEKPVLKELLDSFGPLWLARAEEQERLKEEFAPKGLALPKWDENRSSSGVSLLSDAELSWMWPHVVACFESYLPLFAEQERLLPGKAAVEAFFAEERDTGFTQDFLRAVIDADTERLSTLSRLEGLDAASLVLASEFSLSTVLRALTDNLVAQDDGETSHWPLWTQGYCPVCGRLPVMDWLGKGYEDKNNPYLTAGGGRKFLHCGLCGADWRFRRAICPACGSEKKGCMETFYASTNQTEHVSFCSECKKYCVGLDMRNISPVPDLDVMAFCMLPLDMLAAEKELVPMCRTSWNQF